MVFVFEGSFKMDAENVDEAFALLAAHFQSLSEGGDSVLDIDGQLEVKPE